VLLPHNHLPVLELLWSLQALNSKWKHTCLCLVVTQVPELHKIIESIDDEKLGKMQSALRCAAQHMVWSSITGGFMGESGERRTGAVSLLGSTYRT
jgi:hypothetical protein